MSNNDPSKGEGDHYAPPVPPVNTDYRHARWPRLMDDLAAAPRTRQGQKPAVRARPAAPAVLVVGVCSSGKSTLVSRLREMGIDAQACAQEHSYIPHLWQLSSPGVLVYLDASLPVIRRRRRPSWEQNLLDSQHFRLRHARQHCDMYIITDDLRPEEVASTVVDYLRAKERNGPAQEHPPR